MLHQTTDVRGPREDVIQLPMAAGEPDVQVRFHNYEADFDWWWEVDDVFIGNRTCDPVRGGLVVGNVRSTGGEGINGATVTSLDKPDENATSAPTPDDAALDDGFYWMFSSLTGSHPFEATANQYQSQTRSLSVPANWVVQGDFALGSGRLTVEPTSLETTSQLGGNPRSRTFTITNEGDAPVNVELSERPGGFEMQRADGSSLNGNRIARMEGAALQKIKAPVSFAAEPNGKTTPDAAPDAIAPSEAPWTDIADYPKVVMDNRVVYVDGVAYSIAGGSGSASYSDVYAYDPATLAWTAKASVPALATR